MTPPLPRTRARARTHTTHHLPRSPRQELLAQRADADAEKERLKEQTRLAKAAAEVEHAKLTDEAVRAKQKEAENEKLRMEIEQMKIMAAKDAARRKREEEKHDAEIAAKAVAEREAAG